MPELTPPPQSPGAGRRWVLQRGVNVFTGNGLFEQGVTIGGENTYNHSANYGLAGATDYVLGRWIYAQVNLYRDNALEPVSSIMAIEPEKESGSPFIAVYDDVLILPPADPTTVWPPTIRIRYVNYVLPPPGTINIGVGIIKWVGDVWANPPVDSSLKHINPQSPLLDPMAVGIQLTWPRQHGRVPLNLHELGGLGGLTWDGRNAMWDGEKLWVLDGLHLHYEVLPHGGYTLQGDYRFSKLPGSDDGSTGTGGQAGQGLFTLDETELDDPDYPLG